MVRPPVVLGLSLCRTEIRYAAYVPPDGPSTADTTKHVGVIDLLGAAEAISALFLRFQPDLARYHWSDADEVWIGQGAWSEDELAFLTASSGWTGGRFTEVAVDGVDQVRILRAPWFEDSLKGWIHEGLSGCRFIEWTDMDLAARHPRISSVRNEDPSGGEELPVLVMHATAHRLTLSQFRGEILLNATMIDMDDPVELTYGLAARMRTLAWMRSGHSSVHLFGEHAARAFGLVRDILPGVRLHRGAELAGGGVMQERMDGNGLGPSTVVPAEGMDRFTVAMILASHPVSDGEAALMDDAVDQAKKP
jgi:hypothetical protein